MGNIKKHYFESMKVLVLLLLSTLIACNQEAPATDHRAELDSLRREFEGARQERLLKRDTAKMPAFAGDTAFRARLKAAEALTDTLRQAVGRKKQELKAQRR